MSANEVFLGYLAARTERIHLGSGIFNVTPPVNHPARVAERVAMLDHLSHGRFEFGMGRGSSTTEQGGFGIDDPELTRDMFDEVVARVPPHVGRRRVLARRALLLDAVAQRAAEALHEAAPADVGGRGQPVDVREGGPDGARRPLLHDGRSRADRAAHRDVQGGDRARGTGRRVRERQRHGDDAAALPRGSRAGARPRVQPHDELPEQPPVPVPRHLPASARHPRVARPDPGTDSGRYRRAHRGGCRDVRHAPTTSMPVVQAYEAAGADQVVFGLLSSTMPRDVAVETIELFGTHVLPEFDRDPVHRTTRQRDAQVGASSYERVRRRSTRRGRGCRRGARRRSSRNRRAARSPTRARRA